MAFGGVVFGGGRKKECVFWYCWNIRLLFCLWGFRIRNGLWMGKGQAVAVHVFLIKNLAHAVSRVSAVPLDSYCPCEV